MSGILRPGTVPGGAACRLEISLGPDVPAPSTLILDGVCSAGTLFGSITTPGPRLGWLARQIFWWNSSDSGGRYWLTGAGFSDQSGHPEDSLKVTR